MKLNFSLSFLVFLTLFISSCDRPECKNQNPIFDQQEPHAEPYKAELANQLKKLDSEKLRYWLKKYEQQNGVESLYFYVQGEGLCAIMQMSMEHWNRMENIRKKKGVGRRGAEFTKLKYDIIQDSLSIRFVYRSFDRLID